MIAFGGIYACALRELLVAQAQTGDEMALRLLLSAVPANMPKAVHNAKRNDGLRDMAIRLQALHPGIADYRVAAVLLAVGAAAEDRRPLDVTVVAGLSGVEVDELKMYAGGMLTWLTGDRAGRRWPSMRTIRRAIE